MRGCTAIAFTNRTQQGILEKTDLCSRPGSTTNQLGRSQRAQSPLRIVRYKYIHCMENSTCSMLVLFNTDFSDSIHGSPYHCQARAFLIPALFLVWSTSLNWCPNPSILKLDIPLDNTWSSIRPRNAVWIQLHMRQGL